MRPGRYGGLHFGGLAPLIERPDRRCDAARVFSAAPWRP